MTRSLLLTIVLAGLAPARAEAPPPPPRPAPAPAPEARTEAPAEAEPPASAARAEGLNLPAVLDVDPSEGYVYLRPRWAGAGKVVRIEWSVSSVGGAEPHYTDFGPAGLVVAAPGPEEQVLVHAAALVQPADPTAEPWIMTPIAETIIRGNSPAAPIAAAAARPTTLTAPTPTAAAAIPPPGQGLSVVLVFDAATAPPELAKLVQSPTLRQALASAGAKLYAYDAKSPVLVSQRIKPVVDRARTLPVLVIIAPGGRRVLPAGEAIPLPLSGDAAADEQVLLNVVGRASG